MTLKTNFCGWAIKWRSEYRIEGKCEYLEGRFRAGVGDVPPQVAGYITMVFATRDLARTFIDVHYGYIRRRPDLRAEPHGWKMPVVVKVAVRVEEIV